MHVGTTPDIQTVSSSVSKTHTVLQTARVLVHGKNGKSAYATVLFDTGADNG
jgi:hypothetical protein